MEEQQQTLVVQFGIGTPLCYLSHLETLTLFERALVRTGLALRFSKGFNPRPRLSLPFPRGVGICGDQELLCAAIEPSETGSMAEQMQRRLAEQMPDGLTIGQVIACQGRIAYHPQSVLYIFSLAGPLTQQRQRRLEQLRETLGGIINVCRRKPGRQGPQNVDIGRFIEGLQWLDNQIRLRCRICPDGTARIEELLGWLELESADLEGPVQRTDIKWD